MYYKRLYLHILLLSVLLCFTLKSMAVTDSVFVIQNIFLKGNKVTREGIIYRELVFAANDTLKGKKLGEALKRSYENLMNASIFNFVTIDTAGQGHNPRGINVTISFTERWFTWPTPIFNFADRNFNSWWEHRSFERLNYGIYFVQRNFRGRRESLLLKLLTGYDENYSLFYEIPYITSKQNFGAGFGISYAGNHEVAYKTERDKLVYYKNEKKHSLSDVNGVIQLTYRFKIYDTYTLRLLYDQYHFDDSLILKNPNYSISHHKNLKYTSLLFQYKNDHRDYKPYPLKGHYFDTEINKFGLGLIPYEKISVFYIKSTLRNYWQIYRNWYAATGITTKISDNGDQPYYMLRGLGYIRDFVRGYEYYVIDGENFFLLKANIKYQLVKPAIFNIGFIKTEKFSKVPYTFYINLFTDWAYVKNKDDDNTNTLPNNWLNGNGIGLDFVTYYDKVLRLEFSVNGKGESGIFVHFISPI